MSEKTQEEIWQIQNSLNQHLSLLTERSVLYGEVSLPLWRRIWYRIAFALRIYP